MIDVKKLSKLARLQLNPNEEKLIGDQLNSVFENFKAISGINTEGVEPMITPSDIEEWLREDHAEVSMTPELALQNAPDKSGNLFKVPPVV